MAESSHNDWIDDDYIDDYYQDTETPAPPVDVDIDFDLGTVVAPRHRTSMGTPHLLDLVYWPPASPWAPYDVEPIFGIQTNMGLYCWGKVMPPQSVLDLVHHAESTLIEVGPIPHRSTALGRGLLGSVNATDRPTSYVTIYDEFGFFLNRFDVEIFAGMPAGLFTLVKRQWLIPRLLGTAGEISVDVARQQVRIAYGHFARQEP